MGKKLNERLKDLREDNDMLQKEVAEKIECATFTYQRYEYGDQLIPIDKLMKLAEIYKVSTDYILGLTDIREPYPINDPKTPNKKSVPVDWKNSGISADKQAP